MGVEGKIMPLHLLPCKKRKLLEFKVHVLWGISCSPSPLPASRSPQGRALAPGACDGEAGGEGQGSSLEGLPSKQTQVKMWVLRKANPHKLSVGPISADFLQFAEKAGLQNCIWTWHLLSEVTDLRSSRC